MKAPPWPSPEPRQAQPRPLRRASVTRVSIATPVFGIRIENLQAHRPESIVIAHLATAASVPMQDWTQRLEPGGEA